MPTRQADRLTAAQLLRSLPPQHRKVLVATYFRRRTTTDAARQLNLTPEDVKFKLYQAMRHLSDQLDAA